MTYIQPGKGLRMRWEESVKVLWEIKLIVLVILYVNGCMAMACYGICPNDNNRPYFRPAGCYAILWMLHYGSMTMSYSVLDARLCKLESMPRNVSPGDSLQDQYNAHAHTQRYFIVESMLTKCFVPNCVQYN